MLKEDNIKRGYDPSYFKINYSNSFFLIKKKMFFELILL